jgi:predicted acylesterase/phospholipase RssA
MQRRDFLLACGASGLTPALIGASAAPTPPESELLRRALVLSGGGARGAYAAGYVGALAARLRDGTPLPDYDLVCGTSIGALNGWFVASGQYTQLHELWYGISGEGLIQAKQEFAALRDPDSGIFNRVASALHLLGLRRDIKAVLEAQAVFSWIAHNIDLNKPLLMPLIWAVTNLTTQRPEYFYMRAPGQNGALSTRVTEALKLLLGPNTVVREATPDIFHRAIFASAAIPLAFDPVMMPGQDGTLNAYCDGGVASNSPVGIAHAVSQTIDVVLLDPPFGEGHNTDAVEIGLNVFGTMQRQIIESEMRSVSFQSAARRAFEARSLEPNGQSPRAAATAHFLQSVPAADLRYVRPKAELPVSVVGFSDEVGIGKAYRLGWQDTVPGFVPYNWEQFEL